MRCNLIRLPPRGQQTYEGIAEANLPDQGNALREMSKGNLNQSMVVEC